MKKNILVITLLILIPFLLLSTNSVQAYSYSAFVGAYNNLPGSYNCSLYAKNCFSAKASRVFYHYNEFTYYDISTEVKNIGAFYVDCHGGNDGVSSTSFPGTTRLSIQTDDFSMNSDDMYSYTSGSYKFVFIDACHSGESKAWYYAFNMKTYTGGAMVGWNGPASTDSSYQTFTQILMGQLQNGHTVNDSLWSAYINTGVNNYVMYGNGNLTL